MNNSNQKSKRSLVTTDYQNNNNNNNGAMRPVTGHLDIDLVNFIKKKKKKTPRIFLFHFL